MPSAAESHQPRALRGPGVRRLIERADDAQQRQVGDRIALLTNNCVSTGQMRKFLTNLTLTDSSSSAGSAVHPTPANYTTLNLIDGFRLFSFFDPTSMVGDGINETGLSMMVVGSRALAPRTSSRASPHFL